MELVYHYTSLQTLLTIIRSRTWRFTNIGFLNDGNEYHYAWDLARSLGVVGEDVQDTRTRIHRYFVSCLSGDGDSFSQWYMYGDSGHGVAIGIDPNCLETCIDTVDHTYIRNVDVIYSKATQTEQLSKLLVSNSDNHQWRELIIENQLAELAFQIKQPAFASEQERRLVVCFEWLEGPEEDVDWKSWRESADKILKYECDHGKLKPFLLMQLIDLSFIKSITLGPKTDKHIEKVLNQLLWRADVSNIAIGRSSIEAK